MSRTPSVGFVIGQLHRGGAEGQLAAIAGGLKHDHGIQPTVYCLSEVVEPYQAILEDDGIPVRSYPRRGLAGIRRPWSLRKHLVEDRIDVVHAMLLGPSVHTAISTLGWRRVRFVASYLSADQYRSPMRRRIESWAMGRAERIHVNSQRGLVFARDYYGLPEERFVEIPNGVRIPAEEMPGRDEARRTLGLPRDASVLVGVFRLSEEKNLETFVQVAERVIERQADGYCLIAGDGPRRGWLEDRLRSSGCGERIRLLGAIGDVPSLLAGADLLLLASRHEGLPNAVLEAMAAGLPVVATAVGDLPRLVDDGRTGYLRGPDDVDGLVSACSRVLENRAGLAARLGQAGLQRIRDEFSMERMVGAFAEMYAGLVR